MKKKAEKVQDEDQIRDEGKMNESLVDEIVDEAIEGKDAIRPNDGQDAEASFNEGMEKLKSELDEQRDTVLRMSAEFQNYKRRMEKEKSDIYKFANEKMIMDLLPVMDNFERAMQMIGGEDNPKILDGLEMIKKGFNDMFAKNGIEAIETVNADFDPNMHQAVMVEACDGVEADKVIMELQKGYTLNGKVIRPAMVKVSN